MTKDCTLELIRERATSTLPTDVEPSDTENWQKCWDAACVWLAREMCSEGLIATAREIISWHSTNEKQSVAHIHIDDECHLVYGPTDEDIGIIH